MSTLHNDINARLEAIEGFIRGRHNVDAQVQLREVDKLMGELHALRSDPSISPATRAHYEDDFNRLNTKLGVLRHQLTK